MVSKCAESGTTRVGRCKGNLDFISGTLSRSRESSLIPCAVSAKRSSCRRAGKCAGRRTPGPQRSKMCRQVMVVRTSLRLVTLHPVAGCHSCPHAARSTPALVVLRKSRFYRRPPAGQWACRKRLSRVSTLGGRRSQRLRNVQAGLGPGRYAGVSAGAAAVGADAAIPLNVGLKMYDRSSAERLMKTASALLHGAAAVSAQGLF